MHHDTPIRQCLSAYRTLHTTLTTLQKKPFPLTQVAERSFRLSYAAWEQMEKLAVSLPISVEATIYWNRRVRPLFIAELEYALLLYHAALFVPACPKAALKFWRREALRGSAFKRQHDKFIAYLHSGRSDREMLFFACRSSDYFPGAVAGNEIAGPVLLGRFTALRRYEQLIQNEISLITRV